MLMKQTTDTILMIRPASFGYNPETASSNAFQKKVDDDTLDQANKAISELNDFSEKLVSAGVNVVIVDDTPLPRKPDAVFPNNWFSTFADGGARKLFIYPMMSDLRKNEARSDIVSMLERKFGYETADLRNHSGILEGTGSIVFDHIQKRAYAAVSPRTDEALVNELCGMMSYIPVTFHAADSNGVAVYHTNVILTIGETFAVVCDEMIRNADQRSMITNMLAEGGRELIRITEQQVRSYAGNMIQLRNSSGERILVMSSTAFANLTNEQKSILQKHNSMILTADINTIETTGGGSARCMIAELFH